MLTHSRQAIQFQQGFSLIEVLITVLVLAIGLLGLAGLHAQALRFSHNAYLRSHATLLGNEMADRMRANLVGVAAGSYDDIDGNEANPGCIAVGCSAAQMANYDGYIWNRTIARALPNGSGTVQEVPAGSGIFVITLNWAEQTEGARADKSFEMRFRP